MNGVENAFDVGDEFDDAQLNSQVDFSFLDFNTQNDTSFNDYPDYNTSFSQASHFSRRL